MQDSGRNEVLWGILILAVTGGITLGTYIAAGPGQTYWIVWGGIAWGAYKVLRGWVAASAFWRVMGALAVGAMVLGAVLVLQSDLADPYNSAKAGDCLDKEGLTLDCDGTETYKVDWAKLYPKDMAFPGQARFDADAEVCSTSFRSYYFHPTRESWEDGDRSLLCAKNVRLDPDDHYNSFEVGDCVDEEGIAAACGGPGIYEVQSVTVYPRDMNYPGEASLEADGDACSGSFNAYFFQPTREGWEDGDRSLLCTENLLLDPDDHYNSFKVGDCVDEQGVPAACSGPEVYEVLHVKVYPRDMNYPGEARFATDSRACLLSADLYFYPQQKHGPTGTARFSVSRA